MPKIRAFPHVSYAALKYTNDSIFFDSNKKAPAGAFLLLLSLALQKKVHC